MQNDEPLLLKLAVNITPFGTLDSTSPPIGHLTREARHPLGRNRQASTAHASEAGKAQPWLRRTCRKDVKAAERLRQLDKEALRLGLKSEKKNEFLCTRLGWAPGTSAKRLRLLRAEFKNQPTEKAK